MNKVLRFLRLDEWIDSKVPMVIGAFLCFCTVERADDYLLRTVVLFLYVSMFLAISYIANDFSDRTVDRIAGKKKVISEMPNWLVFFSVLVMFLIGNVPLFFMSNEPVFCILIIVFTYFWGLAYSVPPLRFKEKGVWGLIECSVAQRCLPLLAIPMLCKTNWPAMLIWLLLSFLNGLRYILIHQYLDRENDLASGVETYVSSGVGQIRVPIVCCFTIELILCFVLILMVRHLPLLFIGAGVFLEVLTEYSAYTVLHLYAGKDWLTTFDSVPLDGYYNVLFPLMLVGGLQCSAMQSACIAVLLLLMNSRVLFVKYGFIKVVYQSKFQKVR